MDGSDKRRGEQPRTLCRELSWLQFNQRVQAEADNPDNPLLERAKFLSIVASNLDEFIQVRYHRLLEAAQGPDAGRMLACGLTPAELMLRVNKAILRQQNLQYMLYEGVHSELYHQGVQFYPVFMLTDAMRARCKEIFLHDLLPRLHLAAWNEELEPLPQKKLLMLVRLRPRTGAAPRFATVALSSSQKRIYDLPGEGGTRYCIRQEDLVKQFLPLLFPEDQAEEASLFRFVRNQDFPLNEGDDVATSVREMLLKRRTGAVMRLEAEERMSADMLALLMKRFGVTPERRYRVTGPLDLSKLLMTLYGQMDRPELKYPKAEPVTVKALTGEDIFANIARKDWLLYHPYHSFEPVVNLLNQAAADVEVCSVKATLYRVGGNSPVVRALQHAAENGKQVTVLFEARARFDEENNLLLGERLRRAGCTVLFGVPHYKTHSKALLITRMENGVLKRYLHLGTGNYHDGTARLYTDLGLLTADPRLGEDAARFFYGLEGNGQPFAMTSLYKAPEDLKPALLTLIGRETRNALCGLPAGIVAKMNGLLDVTVINALYEASRAGVPVELIVRGVCALMPGVPGLSENIRVTSIIGRQLEHARAFCFLNGGEPEVYLSSADWMGRNLDRRVELMFPVRDAACKQAVCNLLRLQLADTCKAWRLLPDGTYIRSPADGRPTLNAQETLQNNVDAVLGGGGAWIDSRPEPDGKAETP